jgi:predicted enzyme related to lactoylglutathione lyase
MGEQRTYPPGVPCWIDVEQPDPAAASRFYGGLFGWTFSDVVPAGEPGSYLVAELDGQDVAAVGPGEGPSTWNTYVAVEDADATTAAAVAAGGAVVAEPRDAGPGGRTATCVDPLGASFRLWQPRRRPGAQRVNQPGTWNFSNLHTTDPAKALAFYSTVFGWVAEDMGEGAEAMLRVPGYGDHLARTVDPDIHQRQAGAPPGFADAIAALEPAGTAEPPHWHVKFTVADRDRSAALADRLGATIVSTSQTPWTREALVRDPQGAEFSLSQFTPPG